MIFRSLVLAAVAAVSFSAQAGLMTITNFNLSSGAPALTWPPVGSTGLAGVLFNGNTSGEDSVALGAHAYRNGLIPIGDTDGISIFNASPGRFGSGPNPLYANWSFDFSYLIGAACNGCFTTLSITTTDFAHGTRSLGLDGSKVSSPPSSYDDSWNMEMGFLSSLNFDPFASSSTHFVLGVNAPGHSVVSTDITVNVVGANNKVPEPGTLALVGVALAGFAATRRRKI